MILFEMSVCLSTLVLGVLVAVLFSRKRSSLPRLWIVVASASVIASFIDAAMIDQLPSDLLPADVLYRAQTNRVLAAIFAGVWIAYFLRSARVRATFVRRRTPA